MTTIGRITHSRMAGSNNNSAMLDPGVCSRQARLPICTKGGRVAADKN